MMKEAKKILILFLLLLVFSCNNQNFKNNLTEKVRNDINKEFSRRSSESNIKYSFTSFGLVYKKDNEYTGILETIENGEEFKYEVSVTVDGDSYLWKIIE